MSNSGRDGEYVRRLQARLTEVATGRELEAIARGKPVPESVREIRALVAESVERSQGGVEDTERSATIKDRSEAIWELGDAVGRLRSGEVGWSGLERERLLVAVEEALAAHSAGTVSAVALDTRALLGVIRGATPRTVELEVAEAAKAHTRSAMADPTRAGHVGSFLYGICGMDNEVTGEVDEMVSQEIERAYVAGAALMRSNAAVNVDAEPLRRDRKLIVLLDAARELTAVSGSGPQFRANALDALEAAALAWTVYECPICGRRGDHEWEELTNTERIAHEAEAAAQGI